MEEAIKMKIRRVPKLQNIDKEALETLMLQLQPVYSRVSLIALLNDLKERKLISKSTKYNHFVQYLINELEILERIKVDLPNDKKTERYVISKLNVHPFEIALSLNPGAYISHYSALFIHDLTHNVPKDIYINREQTSKPKNLDNMLTQKKIDYAFNRPMRLTNQIAKFNYRKKKYNVFMLNGKFSNNLGVILKKTPHTYSPVQVTNFERTVIDCLVRPKYAGGVEELINVFERAKEQLSINRMMGILKKLDYIYPYEKSIIFYLIRTGYSEGQIKIVKEKINKNIEDFDFYLDYQMPNKVLDEEIGVYYPKRFLP